MERISKGKAHKKDEFGIKVSVAGMLAEPGNPHDGHALGRSIAQVARMTNCAVQRSFVDRGHRGRKLEKPQVLIPGRKRGLTPQMKKELRRRSAVEPVTGHMKNGAASGVEITW